MLKTCISRFIQSTALKQKVITGLTQCQCPCRRIFTGSPYYSAKEDEVMGQGDKILRVKLLTTRLDLILKSGLSISRSKVEKAFYEDRVRVNGQRPKKKSQSTDERDEIDIVKGPNKMNPLFIDVNRVEILEIGNPTAGSDDDEEEYDSGDENEGSDKTPIVLKRYKNLTIENYSTPWKGNVSS